MRYSRLQWTHASPAEPVEICSEYDQDGWERRKVELFADGTVRYASATESVGDSQLSLIPRPPDEEVSSEPEFRVFEMTEEEFERTWERARQTNPAASTGTVPW
jgi:hypothetical protein